MNTTILCTLFNYFYLDKALVLYDSLTEVSENFKLYILCMDDRCYSVLSDLKYPQIIPIRLSDFEDDQMLVAKGNRSFGEYCWTCSSALICYVLDKYKEHICTYIDADMYFYNDPELLIDEMRMAGKNVLITPHRFTPDKEKLLVNGEFCVEFNTFVNEENSLNVLREWKNNCLQCCTSVNDGVHFGDQKYLDVWPTQYPQTVHVCNHPGAGIAPWNIGWYKQLDLAKKTVLYKKDCTEVPIVFYHFHHVTYISENEIKIGLKTNQKNIDYNLVNDLYVDYLNKIKIKKKWLESRYDVRYLMKEHPIMNRSLGLSSFWAPIKAAKLLVKRLIKRDYVIKLDH